MSEKKTINCTLNGVAVSVPEGTRIIEAAEQVGVGIAHYCYHAALSAPPCAACAWLKCRAHPSCSQPASRR
jgi:NADH dehydrogenase/NADH:ubiquinone oxidoreductase subunit G